MVILRLGPRFVLLPDSQEKWNEIADGFEDICGFPNCCFAIDGCLFEIERPHDFEGWYCRKSYPAINAQVVVDHKTRIISYDLRPSSANDKSVYNYSTFGKEIDTILPKGKYGVGDAGYTLLNRLLIPYPIEESMIACESLYKYLHSKTRITVEQAFGSLKNRFRIFKAPLNQKPDEQSGQSQTQRMATVIKSCMILHNILIFIDDDMNQDIATSGNGNDQNEIPDEGDAESPSSGEVLREQVKSYLLINRDFLRQ